MFLAELHLYGIQGVPGEIGLGTVLLIEDGKLK
jgi:hypothetical protein